MDTIIDEAKTSLFVSAKQIEKAQAGNEGAEETAKATSPEY